MAKHEVIKAKQFDENVPIEFFRLEDNIDLFNFDYHYQCNFYQIYWFTKADGASQIVDFESYQISTNQIWIIYPGQMHNINPIGVKAYLISVNKDYFNRILSKELKNHKFSVTPPLWFELSQCKSIIFESLMLLFQQEWDTCKRSNILEKYLQLYILHIQELKELSYDNLYMDSRVYTLLELVEEHYAAHYPSSFYADRIAISVKRMNELIVKATDFTLSQHLHKRILLEAKRLIGYSDLNIQEISAELGFNEVSYFNRFFKKYTGITPLLFRKEVKKVQ